MVPKKKKEEKIYDENYLYLENAGLVVEFRPESEPKPLEPEFIYGANTGPRLIEFYAPWCSHCRKFRDHYVELAQQLSDVAVDVGAPEISFHAVSCKVHRDLCRDFQINGYPQLKTFPAGASKPSAVIKLSELHPTNILNNLQLHVHRMNLGSFETHSDSEGFFQDATRALSIWFQPQHQHQHFPRTKQEIFDDAYRSFDFNLRQGIYTSKGPLEPPAKKALFSWLELLRKTMPVTWKIHYVIRAILDEFEKAASGEEQLLEILKPFPTPPGDWSSACKKGVPGVGYTCGLWELFHIMSIGFVEWNVQVPLGAQGDKRMAIESGAAGDTLRAFIFHFFGCEVCRTNFIKSYDECQLDRCNRLTHRKTLRFWKKLPDYLFELHNTVNVRLVKEKAAEKHTTPSDEDEINVKWPRKEDCPTCWLEDGKWDVDTMYKYLRIEYWPEDTTTKDYRKDLGIDMLNREQALGKDGDSDLNYSPLLAVWISAAILIMVIIWRKKLVLRRSGFHKKRDEQ